MILLMCAHHKRGAHKFIVQMMMAAYQLHSFLNETI